MDEKKGLVSFLGLNVVLAGAAVTALAAIEVSLGYAVAASHTGDAGAKSAAVRPLDVFASEVLLLINLQQVFVIHMRLF